MMSGTKEASQKATIQSDQFTSIPHGFDGKNTTRVSALVSNPLVAITEPAQGKYYVSHWNLSQSDASGKHLLFGLDRYQKSRGYSYTKRFDKKRGLGNQKVSDISGQTIPSKNCNTAKFPVIMPRFFDSRSQTNKGKSKKHPHHKVPDPIDFKIKLKGKVSGAVKKLYIYLLTEKGDPLTFVKNKKVITNIEVSIKPGSKTWEAALPSLEKPYFGVAQIAIEYDVVPPKTSPIKPKPPQTTVRSKVPVNRKIVLLGLQLGVFDADNNKERTVEDECMITDFTNPKYYKGLSYRPSLVRFRTRRMQLFLTTNEKRKIFFPASAEDPAKKRKTKKGKTRIKPCEITIHDRKWQEETRTAPKMPSIHLETQVLGLSQRSMTLIRFYFAEPDSKGPKLSDKELDPVFRIYSKLNANYHFACGRIRTARKSKRFKLYEVKDEIKGETCLQGYSFTEKKFMSHYEHHPHQATKDEYEEAKPRFEKRHWMQLDNAKDWQFEYEATVIPWQPATGYWADIDHYVQRIRGGNVDLSAKVTLFGDSYDLSAPSLFVKVANPTVAQVKEFLAPTRLDNMLANATAMRRLSASNKNNIENFLSIFGKKDWLEVLLAIFWHESGSNKSSSWAGIALSDSLEINCFVNSRTKGIRATKNNRVYLNIKNQPTMGYPGGWGMGQLDNPRPEDDEIWDWGYNALDALRLFTIEKLSWAMNRGRWSMPNSLATNSDYKKKVGDPKLKAKGEYTYSSGKKDVWYSNKIRDGKLAKKYLESCVEQERKDAVNVIAWLAVRAYNGTGSNWHYPYKVGADAYWIRRAPFFIGKY